MEEYVKPDAMIAKVATKAEPVLDAAMEAKILGLEKIDEFTVRKVGARSRQKAREWLAQMHQEKKILLKAERLAELYPPKIEDDETKIIEK